jgi:hypothetical protein
LLIIVPKEGKNKKARGMKKKKKRFVIKKTGVHSISSTHRTYTNNVLAPQVNYQKYPLK